MQPLKKKCFPLPFDSVEVLLAELWFCWLSHFRCGVSFLPHDSLRWSVTFCARRRNGAWLPDAAAADYWPQDSPVPCHCHCAQQHSTTYAQPAGQPQANQGKDGNGCIDSSCCSSAIEDEWILDLSKCLSGHVRKVLNSLLHSVGHNMTWFFLP